MLLLSFMEERESVCEACAFSVVEIKGKHSKQLQRHTAVCLIAFFLLLVNGKNNMQCNTQTKGLVYNYYYYFCHPFEAPPFNLPFVTCRHRHFITIWSELCTLSPFPRPYCRCVSCAALSTPARFLFPCSSRVSNLPDVVIQKENSFAFLLFLIFAAFGPREKGQRIGNGG